MRTYTCSDCGSSCTHLAARGRLPERCETCRAIRKRDTDSAKSKRWREANATYQASYMREYHKRHKDDPEYRRRRREAFLIYKYGLTQADVDALIESQGNRCGICLGERNGPGTRLHIDHCHDTGRVRGLLCSKCNTAVGLLDNDPERAEQVARYLRT